MCTHPKEDPARFRIPYRRPGNICRSSVLYRAKHDNATWGVVREQWQVPPHFLRPALRHHSQARCPATIPSTESWPDTSLGNGVSEQAAKSEIGRAHV